jgi:hypothetical protein
MDPFTAAMVVGAGVQAFGQWQSGKAAARAARKQAQIKRAMADQMLQQMKIQEGRLRSQGDEFKSKQNVEYAAGGVQLGTGATLIAMEDTNQKINMSVEDLKRETMFKINQLKAGASVDMQQGRDAQTAGSIMAAGSILEGAAAYKKYGK